MTKNNEYPEELTTAMHSEFAVSDELDLLHKIGSIWAYDPEISDADAQALAESYGLDWDLVMSKKDEALSHFGLTELI